MAWHRPKIQGGCIDEVRQKYAEMFAQLDDPVIMICPWCQTRRVGHGTRIDPGQTEDEQNGLSKEANRARSNQSGLVLRAWTPCVESNACDGEPIRILRAR